MTHPSNSEIHRYHDGELNEEERWAVRSHLLRCEECAEEQERILELSERMGRLPASVVPTDELWAGIAERIGQTSDELSARRSRSRGRPFVWAAWITAIAAALVLGIGLGRLLPDANPSQSAAVTLPENSAVLLASYEQPGYDEAVAELEQFLDSMRSELEPETVAVVEQNLAIIDQAIEEARRAILDDPVNEQLHQHLGDTMQQKLRLLRTVTLALSAS